MGTKRRAVLGGSLLAVGGALLGAATAGCGNASPAPPRTPGPAGSSPRRVLLAYFSRAGENYWYGGRRTLDVGNTQIIAEMIASLVRADVYRIEAAEPYPDSYDATVQRNVAEQNADARPAIAGALPDARGYDVVLLGSGIWNVRPPMIMSNFAERAYLAGTTIHPFVTFAVSGLGSTVEEYRRLCPEATIGAGLAVRGEEVAGARSQVEAWLREIGLR
ncbi:flavodoxin [Dactylosporangium sp. NPDC049742]|uniref:flavodoxin n=1 Tax=Dactylosporangium sp. NPDC049742 TaxID=3154737 RepID=UPI00344AF262